MSDDTEKPFRDIMTELAKIREKGSRGQQELRKRIAQEVREDLDLILFCSDQDWYTNERCCAVLQKALLVIERGK